MTVHYVNWLIIAGFVALNAWAARSPRVQEQQRRLENAVETWARGESR